MGHKLTSEILFSIVASITVIMIIGWKIYFQELFM